MIIAARRSFRFLDRTLMPKKSYTSSRTASWRARLRLRSAPASRTRAERSSPDGPASSVEADEASSTAATGLSAPVRASEISRPHLLIMVDASRDWRGRSCGRVAPEPRAGASRRRARSSGGRRPGTADHARSAASRAPRMRAATTAGGRRMRRARMPRRCACSVRAASQLRRTDRRVRKTRQERCRTVDALRTRARRTRAA